MFVLNIATPARICLKYKYCEEISVGFRFYNSLFIQNKNDGAKYELTVFKGCICISLAQCTHNSTQHSSPSELAERDNLSEVDLK